MEAAFSRLYSVAMLSAAGVWALVGLLVLAARNKSTYARLWVVTSLLVAVSWTSMHLVTHVVQSRSAALLLTRVAFSTGPTSCLAFFCFGLAFLRQLLVWRRVILASVALDGLLVVLACGTDLLFTDLRDYGAGLRYPAAGPLMPLYAGLELFWLGCPSILFFRAWRRERGRTRLQLGYLSVAIMCMAVAGVGSLVPTLGRENLVALVPMLGMVVGPVIITYAIIRHQLWDIRTVAHKTALWLGASLLVLVPVYLGLRYGAVMLSRSPGVLLPLATLALLALFALHFRVVQPWINHRFARGTRDPEVVVRRFNREVLNLRGVRELAELLDQTLRSGVYATGMTLFVLDAETGTFRAAAGGRDSGIDEDLRTQLLELHCEIDTATLAHYDLRPGLEEKLAAFLRRHQTALLVPLIHEGGLLGLLCLGEKQNLSAYTRGDFLVLEHIRPPATIALSNALLYDRLQQFTASLERRVEQRTRELSEANQKLLELDRAKSKFFANITHELRTPLTLILAPLEDLLLKMGPSHEDAEDLGTMHRNALRLLRNINALLDLARFDAGELRLRPAPLDLNTFVETTVRNFRPIAIRKGLTLSFTPLEGNHATVIADSDKLDLVFANLLANAVKFTDAKGSVHVSILSEDDWLAVSVKDTGIGIPAEELSRIFDRFAQVDSGPTRRYEGAGIGLALVKEIVTLHQGSIAVSSRPGAGSEFRVRLQRQPPPLPEGILERRKVNLPTAARRRIGDADPTASIPFSMDGEAWVSIEHGTGGSTVGGHGDVQLLLVEDNPDMRAYLQRRLAEHFQVTACHNGKEALERVAARSPDIIVSDVMMPEVSGVELCKKLKESRATASIPIILITARKGVDRTLEGFRSGADDYLAKPFNFGELLARVQVQLRIADLGRQLARKEKGAVLNLIAAGLAHEVRNPVNAIVNAAGPLRELMRAPPSEQTRAAADELLEAIRESATRIDRLVSDVLGVSPPHLDGPSAWVVDEALESTLRLLRCKHDHPISVHRSFAHTSPVHGRTNQLNQILMNLLDNAVRAAGRGGTVWVTTEEQDGAFRLRVKDSGTGVPPELRDRIFDPLFTTHGAQGSTGLGLHVSRSIAKEHNGRVELRSPAEGGAEFILELPLESPGSSDREEISHDR